MRDICVMVRTGFPANPRELFDLFRFYREELGIEGLLTDLDTSGLTARDIYHACHARAPENLQAATSHERFSVVELFRGALFSDEFQLGLVARFLSAFPEQRRLSFVHIPKSAGADLSSHLIARYPSFNTSIADPALTGKTILHRNIKSLVLECAVSRDLYLHGHNHLRTYAEWGAARPQDLVFTVLRDPTAQVISQINYVLTRMTEEEEPVGRDTAGWRTEFGISDPAALRTPQRARAVAHDILRHSGVMPSNLACHFLGDGTSRHAIERIAIYNVEVTVLPRYAQWVRTRWNIVQETHLHRSQRFISIDDLSADDVSYLHAITEEDRALYRHVSDLLQARNACCLRGTEVLASAPAA
jgi:hypothetical protein